MSPMQSLGNSFLAGWARTRLRSVGLFALKKSRSGYQLFRVTSAMNLRIQGRLRRISVNLPQWRVMRVLRSHERMRLSRS